MVKLYENEVVTKHEFEMTVRFSSCLAKSCETFTPSMLSAR